MNLKKFIIQSVVFLLSLPVFFWLESGFVSKGGVDLVRPLIFAAALTIFMNQNLRKYLLTIALSLLSLMVPFYLFWQMDISNWVGSLGVGLLAIYIIEYFPKLIKNGFIDKF